MVIKNSTVLFKIYGVVLEGKKKGSKLGFPTVNISCDNSIYGEHGGFDKLAAGRTIPSGIYAGEAIWKGISHPAAIYKSDEKDTIEAHLLDFSDNLYGETITIIAEQKIRDSRFFPSREELIAAISKDIEDIKKIINS